MFVIDIDENVKFGLKPMNVSRSAAALYMHPLTSQTVPWPLSHVRPPGKFGNYLPRRDTVGRAFTEVDFRSDHIESCHGELPTLVFYTGDLQRPKNAPSIPSCSNH